MRVNLPAVSVAASFLWLAACSHSVRPPSVVQPAPPPNAGHPQPLRGAAPKRPTPKPTVLATVRPAQGAPTPTPTPRQVAAIPKSAPAIPRVAPDAAPKILSVAVSETTVSPGDKVSGSVFTTSNVASVQARIGGYAMTLAKVGVGRFALSYTVAQLPWFVHGNFTMRVIATNTRGDTAERLIPLVVR
ncbi:MAG TPA: hypothetical protein VGX91_12885 [Candidatus Cybelea sp.]|nr:hypothetical protein [Candidatus Cybelea sp.]